MISTGTFDWSSAAAWSASDFDVRVAADAFELLADHAPAHAEQGRLDVKGPIVATAVDLLVDTREWLESRRGSTCTFSGDEILRAVTSEPSIEVEAFLDCLDRIVKEITTEAGDPRAA